VSQLMKFHEVEPRSDEVEPDARCRFRRRGTPERNMAPAPIGVTTFAALHQDGVIPHWRRCDRAACRCWKTSRPLVN
jgi:hypothetical protein